MTVLSKTILRGSVATRLRCGGIGSNHLTTHFVQNPPVKEFRKSVKIRQNYHKKFDAPFFMRHSVKCAVSRIGAAIFSQTNAFSVTGETREVTVHSHGDEVVDCSTDVDRQQ